MLTDRERSRFNQLRNRNANGETLTEAESAEVAALTQRIEEAESVYLIPATERLRQENRETDARIKELNELIAREEQFLARLNTTLSELKAERAAIAAERRRLTASTAH